MAEIKVKDGENFEVAMKRFKRKVEKLGILKEVRNRRYYEKPSIKKKKKSIAARKRAAKLLKKQKRKTYK